MGVTINMIYVGDLGVFFPVSTFCEIERALPVVSNDFHQAGELVFVLQHFLTETSGSVLIFIRYTICISLV